MDQFGAALTTSGSASTSATPTATATSPTGCRDATRSGRLPWTCASHCSATAARSGTRPSSSRTPTTPTGSGLLRRLEQQVRGLLRQRPNNLGYSFGPAHRAHVIKEYLDSHDGLTYEQIRDLALLIATTDSFGGGGNPWELVADPFRAAVAANPSNDRVAAVVLLDAWDGHFVAGGPSEWVAGTLRSDAWVLQDAWIREVVRLTFETS